VSEPKEGPFPYESWEDLREALEEMKPRSKLYETIKAEMIKRGRWKIAHRGGGSRSLDEPE
jgi:hypothetical protein